jgi:hypothetical protein
MKKVVVLMLLLWTSAAQCPVGSSCSTCGGSPAACLTCANN